MQKKIIFLEIMNHFIHPEHPLPELGDLGWRDVEELLAMGQIQSVFPVVYDALRTADAFAAAPAQVKTGLRQQVRRDVIGQTLRTEAFLGLYRRILDAGITPLVVKGIVLRSLYGNPDYRASKDEDLLVRREEFSRLDELLAGEGFVRDLPEDPLQSREIPYWHPRTGVHLEVHPSLFPEKSDSSEYAAYGYLNEPFRDAFDHQSIVQIGGVPIHTLEPGRHMLYLVCHGLKHFLHCGFGIRQVMDMVLFAEHYGDRIDWAWMEAWADRQGYRIFWMNLFDLGEKYLGFSWEKAGIRKPEDLSLDCENMLADLLDAGIYGKSSENRAHSANMTLQASAGGNRKGGLLASVFPGIDYMKVRYPYLNRHCWLLPVAWGQRAAGYLHRSGKKEIRQTVEIGNRRVALLKQYGLTENHRK